MISIRSSADMARALKSQLDPDLRRLLNLRRRQLTDNEDDDIAGWAHFIVADPDDPLAAIEAEAGYPLVGERSAVEWAQRHAGGWIEAAVITDDDGFAVVVIARDCNCTDPDLLSALLAHA